MKRMLCCVVGVVLFAGCGSPQGNDTSSAPVAAVAQNDYIHEGVQLLKESKTSEAIKNFDEAIKNDPFNPKGYMILGETYMRLQDYPRAIDSFSAAIRIAPEQGELYYLLAVNQAVMGRREMALENVGKSITLFRAQENEDGFLRSM